MFEKLSIIIPVYNEEESIRRILDRIREIDLMAGLMREIIVVNDCSTDRTGEVVQDYMDRWPNTPIEYFEHRLNQGKGAAIHTGIEEAGGDLIIIQDADLEYDPKEYNILLRPMIEGHADVVYGSRFMSGHAHRIMFFWHSIGNKFLTTLSNAFTNLNLTDMETCYKLFNAEMLKNLNLEEQRFGFEPEVTAKISRVPGVRIYEVGISYYGRTYAEGKKINWKDGLRAIWCILKYNIWSRK